MYIKEDETSIRSLLLIVFLCFFSVRHLFSKPKPISSLLSFPILSFLLVHLIINVSEDLWEKGGLEKKWFGLLRYLIFISVISHFFIFCWVEITIETRRKWKKGVLLKLYTLTCVCFGLVCFLFCLRFRLFVFETLIYDKHHLHSPTQQNPCFIFCFSSLL